MKLNVCSGAVAPLWHLQNYEDAPTHKKKKTKRMVVANNDEQQIYFI